MILFASTFLLTVIGASSVAATPEDSKWIWAEGKARTDRDGVKSVRYQVHEYPSPGPGGALPFAPAVQSQFRPQHPGPYGSESGPIVTQTHRNPPPLVLVGPNGPTGVVGRPGRKPLGPALDFAAPAAAAAAASAGSIPSRFKEDGRYREYDVCKCSYGFNCPGLKFGSCAKSKQYCCYDSRKVNGGHNVYPAAIQNPLPFRPFDAVPSDYYAQHGPQGSHYGSYQTNGHDRYSPYAPEYNGGGPHDVSDFARSASKDEQNRRRSTKEQER